MAEDQGRRKGEAFKFIHNDLMQGAHFFRRVCVEKEKAGNRHGIAWDYTACMLFVAFGFEACINFIGDLKVQGWVEKQSFDKKIKQVSAALGVKPDWSKRPYSSMQYAKDFRDSVAHGKPVREKYDEEGKADDLEARIDLSHGWEKMIEHKQVLECYDDLDVIWKEWLKAGMIDITDTFTRADITVTRIEPSKPA
jgi:hypothetical protein